MTTMQNMIQKARRRTFIDRTLHRSGYGLLVGSGLGLALLTYDRFTASEMSSLIFVIPAALGLIVGILLALRQIPDPMIAAILIDRQMRLQDQFGSAESLLRADSSTENRSGPHYDPEFAELVRREADRLASRIDVRTATPIQVTPIWGGSLALALALWMGVLFIPSRQAKAEPGVAEKTPEQMEEVRQQRQELAATIDETIEQLQDESILDERTREELAALNELADQLSSSSADDLDVEHVRDESAARLNEIADRLAEQSRRDLAARDQVANKFAGLDTPEPPPAAEPFTEAIKRGDFAEAADQLDELTRRSETMTDEQRELVANHLRDLGQQLETSGEVDQLMTEERKGQLEDALRDQGLDDSTIESVMDEPQANDDLQRTLEEQNVDPEIAGELSRDIERLKDQQDFERQVHEDTEQLTEALERAAQQVENPEDSPEQVESSDQESTTEDSTSLSASERETGEEQATESGEQTRGESATEEGSGDQESENATSETPGNTGTDESSPSDPTQESQDDQTSTDGAGEGEENTPSQTEDSDGQPQEQQEEQTNENAQARTEEHSAESPQEQGQEKQQEQLNRANQPEQRPGTQSEEGSDDATPQEQGAPSQTGEQPQGQPQKTPEQGEVPPQTGQEQPEQTSDSENSTSPQQQEGEPQSSPQDQAPGQQPQTDEQTSPKTTPPESQNSQESPDPDNPSTDPNQQQEQPSAEGGEPPLDPEQVQKMMDMLDKMPSSVLRKLAERAQDATRNKEISESLKEQAKKMLEGMSDEQREKLREMFDQPQTPESQRDENNNTGGNQNAQGENPKNTGAGSNRPDGQGNTPGERRSDDDELITIEKPSDTYTFDQTEDIDLRGEGDHDLVVAEWLSEDPIEGEPGRTTRSGRAKRLDKAQDVAQRAVDDSVVPPRYHNLIKRYFGNLKGTIDKAASEKTESKTESSKPATDTSSKTESPKKSAPD